MTKPLRVAIEIIAKCLNKPKAILEIGSRQAINQNEISDMRSLFRDSKFTGVDMQQGPGVDVVMRADNLPFPDKSFDLVLCLETLEHAEKPWLICAEIERVIKTNGVIIVSSPQNFPIHMHPSDYFRYTPHGLKALFPSFVSKLAFSISPPFDNEAKLNPQQVVLVASKRRNMKLLSKVRRLLKLNIDKISGHKPYIHRFAEMIRLFKRAMNELSFRLEVEFFK